MTQLSFIFLILISFITASVNLPFTSREKQSISEVVESIPVCGPAGISGQVVPGSDGRFVHVLPGWGRYEYKISTKSDSSQFYFNQGLNMYYSYHFKEAVASFQQSEFFDPQNAMALWGQALSMGPYYNGAHLYKKPESVKNVLKKMNELASLTSPSEKLLIAAMNARYSEDPSDADRKALNEAYARKMREAIDAEPKNEEMKMLYIDAMMLIHPWDFWSPEGKAREWTPALVALCEQVLKTKPKHPAALHYHIHLTEASLHPEVALGSAETLRDLLPGVAHMVHMSSHEYERNGLYAKGVEVNNLADDNLRYYDMLAANLSLNKQSSHYFAVQTYCALTAGMYKDAVHYAQRTRRSTAPSYENTYDQFLYMLPSMVHVRMGKWQEILSDSIVPNTKWPYAGLLHDFARGIAFINTGQVDSSLVCLRNLREKSKDVSLKKRRIPFNSPTQIAPVAENILEGIILFEQNKKKDALAALERAVKLEDLLIYTEPKDWPIPPRQFLGAYQLKSGQAAAAERTFRQDLVSNPGNGWALTGLAKALEAQKKNRLAEASKSKAKHAFAKADQLPVMSVFMK